VQREQTGAAELHPRRRFRSVEGRARVILDVAEADLEPGDIQVTAYMTPAGRPCSSRSRAW
jgi:hypothetical protein